MPAVSATTPTITPEFVARLAERAQDAERLRRLPADTIDDLNASGFTELLVPARYGGSQADFPAILDPVRRMAHGCASSAWTIGFYALHNWMLALFDERAQEEAFATRPFLAPAPLAPTGRGVPTGEGVRLTGRWSWATGVMHGNWIIVGALCGPDDGIYPALALLPIGDIAIEDVWHTDGMRATGSNDVVITDVFVPGHRLVRVSDIYTGTAPGAGLHDADTYRWPMVPALALLAAMPALGSAERAADIYAERLSQRVLAYEGVTQKDKPIAQAHLAEARVRLRALRGLLADTVGEIEIHSRRGRSGATAGARRCPPVGGAHRARVEGGDRRPSRGVRGQRPLPRQPVAADQTRRRRDLRPRGVRLRHQPRTRRGAHTGYEGVTDRNGVKGIP